MADIPREPKSLERSARETADHEKVREASRAGYQGYCKVVHLSEAVKRRDDARAERERQVAKVHYLDTPPKPR